MSRITKLGQQDLGRAVEENFLEWQQLRSQMPDVTLYESDDVTCLVGGTTGAPNDVVHLHTATGCERRLSEILRQFRGNSQGVEFWIGPSCPAEMIEALRGRQIRCAANMFGMAIDLSKDFSPTKLNIRRLESFDVFEKQPHPLLGKSSSVSSQRNLNEMSVLQRKFPDKVFQIAAELDGVIVGSAMLFLGERDSGIYDLGVLPEYRRRGIGSAITNNLCRQAQQHGFQRMVLIATQQGRQLYRSVGFEDVCSIRLFVWSKTQRRREVAQSIRGRYTG